MLITSGHRHEHMNSPLKAAHEPVVLDHAQQVIIGDVPALPRRSGRRLHAVFPRGVERPGPRQVPFVRDLAATPPGERVPGTLAPDLRALRSAVTWLNSDVPAAPFPENRCRDWSDATTSFTTAKQDGTRLPGEAGVDVCLLARAASRNPRPRPLMLGQQPCNHQECAQTRLCRQGRCCQDNPAKSLLMPCQCCEGHDNDPLLEQHLSIVDTAEHWECTCTKQWLRSLRRIRTTRQTQAQNGQNAWCRCVCLE